MRLSVLLLALFIVPASALTGQERVGVDARVGVAAPLGSFADGLLPGAGLSPGASFTVQVVVPRRMRNAFLVGFAQHRLRCTGSGCGGAGDLVSTAWNLALRMRLRPLGSSPWIRLGAVLDRSEWDFREEGTLVRHASYLGLGGEGGAGVTVSVAERLMLTPGARYVFLNTSFPGTETVRMRYAVVDFGVSFSF